MTIGSIHLHHVDLPLITPYALSYRTFESFEPFLVEISMEDGRTVWGEQHISPGSSSETRDNGWQFLQQHAAACIGLSATDAHQLLTAHRAKSPVAAAAFLNALDQLLFPEHCANTAPLQIPVLSAFSAMTESEIEAELSKKLALGFRTFKIKVGKDVASDRQRVRAIQDCLGGRGHIRVDANRAYNVEQAIAFCDVLDPAVCELFEQPCDSEDWEGNGRVAKLCPVPLMLDEPICESADIERATAMDGVGFCKLKLKRFGSIVTLERAIELAHAKGLGIVLGDGLGSDINCYFEALVSSRLLSRAGEFNGCLKIRHEARITREPLGFSDGHLLVQSGFQPAPDLTRLGMHTVRCERFGI